MYGNRLGKLLDYLHFLVHMQCELMSLNGWLDAQWGKSGLGKCVEGIV